MKLSRSIVLTALALFLAVGSGIFACASNSGNCPEGESCTKDCVNQSDCSDNQTCLNEGICACYKDQNGAQCSNLSDCPPNQTCNTECQCVPDVAGQDTDS